MLTIAFDTLAWSDAPMPDGSGPVPLATLPQLSDGAFRAFVRFPAGWSRTVPGHYPVIEEVLVLEGDLTLGTTQWSAGGYAWVPAHATRTKLLSTGGALVLAWFAAPPRWRRGPAMEPPRDTMRSLPHWERARRAPMLGDANACVLNDARGHETWVTTIAQSFVAPVAMEWLDVTARQWGFANAGEACALTGTTFVRAHA